MLGKHGLVAQLGLCLLFIHVFYRPLTKPLDGAYGVPLHVGSAEPRLKTSGLQYTYTV